MTDYPTLRFNCRLGAHHLAFLLDGTRNGSGVLRSAVDEQIEQSDIDYERLKEAASVVAENSDNPRSEFSAISSTEDVFDRAAEIKQDDPAEPTMQVAETNANQGGQNDA